MYDSEKLLTPNQVATELDVTPEAVRDWLTYGVMVTTPKGGRKRAALRGRKIGGRWKITREDLDAFIDATMKASVNADAVVPEGEEKETEAQYRRRAKEAGRRVMAKLNGEI